MQPTGNHHTKDPANCACTAQFNYFQIVVLLSHEITQYQRSIYTALDMLGDVGGLLDGLKLFGSMVMTMLHFVKGDPLQATIVQALFK